MTQTRLVTQTDIICLPHLSVFLSSSSSLVHPNHSPCLHLFLLPHCEQTLSSTFGSLRSFQLPLNEHLDPLRLALGIKHSCLTTILPRSTSSSKITNASWTRSTSGLLEKDCHPEGTLLDVLQNHTPQSKLRYTYLRRNCSDRGAV